MLPKLRVLPRNFRKSSNEFQDSRGATITPSAMVPDGPAGTKTPLHTPAGIFVIHLRSDSDVSRQRLIGRVEHVMSGDSAPFASLADLLAFMGRHAVEAANDQPTSSPAFLLTNQKRES